MLNFGRGAAGGFEGEVQRIRDIFGLDSGSRLLTGRGRTLAFRWID